jgi:hypothetical protein
VRDLDYVGALPLLAWSALIAVALATRRGASLRAALSGPVAAVAIAAAGSIVASAILVGTELDPGLAPIRHYAHLAALLPLALGMGLAAVLGHERARAAIAIVVFAACTWTNVGTLQFVWRPADRRAAPVSWVREAFGDVLEPRRDPLLDVHAALRREAPPRAEGAQRPTLWVTPAPMGDVLVPAVGDAYQLRPFSLKSSVCYRAIEGALGSSAMARIAEPPDALAWLEGAAPELSGYRRLVVAAADPTLDARRPELTRRARRGDTGAAEPYVLFFRAR